MYGAIIGLALVVALEDHPPPPGVMVATMLTTAFAVGLAELYSDLVGSATRTRRRMDRVRFRRIEDDVAAVAFGIAFPAVFFLLAAARVIDASTAFDVAEWSGLGLIAFYGFCAARLVGARLPAAVLQGLATGLVGGLLILFKALVH